MGVSIASCKPKRTQFLPVTLEFKFEADDMPSDPNVIFSMTGNPGVCDLKLDIIKNQPAALTVLVPESVLSLGQGLYDITVYDDCEPCAVQQLRVQRNCKLRDCVMTEPQPTKPDDNCGKFQTPLN